MDWQQATALGIVVITAALFVASRFRKRRAGGCGCGCAAATGRPQRGTILLRAKKGERRQVIVRPG
jgi:hypothetical protein